MVGPSIDAKLAREGALDTAENTRGEPLGGGVGRDDAQGLLELGQSKAVGAQGGVLVAQSLVLTEEAAVFFLQPVDAPDIAEEAGHGTEDRRGPFFERAGGAQEDILNGVEEAGAPHDRQQNGKGDHGPDPVAVPTEDQHAATVSRLPPRPSRVELLLDGAARFDLVENRAGAADHAEQGILGDVDGEAGLLADTAVEAPEQRSAPGEGDAVRHEVAHELGRRDLDGGPD